MLSNAMDNEDNDLWQKELRDVKPIKKSTSAKSKPPKTPIKSAPKNAATIQPPVTTPRKGNEIDKSTDEKLRKGQIRPESKLDLHGMTQAQAHDALQQFIIKAYKNEKRCVLVVTGKGRSDWKDSKPGILKQNVPRWLNEPPLRDLVLKTHDAQIKDGGTGALYVYLRRNRD